MHVPTEIQNRILEYTQLGKPQTISAMTNLQTSRYIDNSRGQGLRSYHFTPASNSGAFEHIMQLIENNSFNEYEPETDADGYYSVTRLPREFIRLQFIVRGKTFDIPLGMMRISSRFFDEPFKFIPLVPVVGVDDLGNPGLIIRDVEFRLTVDLKPDGGAYAVRGSRQRKKRKTKKNKTKKKKTKKKKTKKKKTKNRELASY